MAKRAVIYARVSTGQQAEAELSIPDQIEAATSYCQQHGLTIVGEYIDPGATAKDDNRPEFQRMVEDAFGGAFDVIVVHSQSRFLRNVYLYEMYCFRFEKVGVEVKSITQDFGDGATAKFIRQMISAFDEYSSGETAKHTLRTMRRNAREGFINGKVPYGFRAVAAETRGQKVKKRAELHPDEADNIRLMFALANSGLTGADPMGVKAIAKELRRLNVRGRKGRFFSATTIHRMLHDTAYIGELVWNKTDSTGKQKPRDEWDIIPVPPIIDKDTFEAVHAAMSQRDPKRSSVRYSHRPTLLSRTACCGTCGFAMRLRTGKSGRYRYYTCSKAELLIDGGCDRPQTIREDLLDSLVVDHLADIVFEPERLQTLLAEAIEAERLDREKAPQQLDRLLRHNSDLDSRIANMHEAIERGTVDRNDLQFGERLKSRILERSEIERQTSSLRHAAAKFPPLTVNKVQEFSAALRSALRTGEPRMRRAYLSFFLARVIVNRHEIRLQGHKGLLAKSYAQDWKTAALATSEGARQAVPTQVHGWGPIGDLSGNLWEATVAVPTALLEPTQLRWAEWMAVKSLLSKALLGNPIAAMEAAHRIAERLNEHSEQERLWRGEVMPGEGLVFSRTRQGVSERYLIDAALLLGL
jgi:site-specific DNA recombinase